VEVGGLTRSYLVYRPQSAPTDAAPPVVLVFHGGGGSTRRMPRFTGFNTAADARAFVVVYPEGERRSWADGRGMTTADRAGVDDVAFTRALLDQLAQDDRIDPGRVYAVGISNGGFLTQRLGCELADRLTAVTTIAATMPGPLLERCHPARPVSALLMMGTDDPLVPFQGGAVRVGAGGPASSLEAATRRWRELDRCPAAPSSSASIDAVDDGTAIEIQTWAGCAGGAEVDQYVIGGGGHTWPGGPQYLPAFLIGTASREIDATAVVTDFFLRHAAS
jgi:polyhydroxybutyrate depolymerase